MIKYEILEKTIREFKLKDKIKHIVYECRYLNDLSIDIEFAIHRGKYLTVPSSLRPAPIIPNDPKNILLYGYPGYMRELGFYGFVIEGYKYKLYYHFNERKGFYTKC